MAELLRRSLLTRIALRAKRDVTALAQHAYLHLYAVPRLKRKGELSSGSSVARGHGVFLLLSEGSSIKLAISPVAVLEYACKGIPAIVTGAAFYAGYGFTLDPRSKEQYEQMLLRIAAMEPLQPQYQEAALLVYGLWNRLAGYESVLIDQQVLRKVWGYEGGRDLEAAYRLVLDRMRSTSLCELDIGKFIELHCGERMC